MAGGRLEQEEEIGLKIVGFAYTRLITFTRLFYNIRRGEALLSQFLRFSHGECPQYDTLASLEFPWELDFYHPDRPLARAFWFYFYQAFRSKVPFLDVFPRKGIPNAI